MKFLISKKRPLLLLLMGAIIIGIGVFQAFSRPPSQVGEFKPGISELIVPTPIFDSTSEPAFLAVPGSTATPIPTLAASPAFDPNRGKADGNRIKIGYEPPGNSLWQQIDSAGKEFPVWISIPVIGLDAPILPATLRKVLMEGKTVDMWFAPDAFAPGWHTTSAFPGAIGNTVLSGHNNDFGAVFARLVDLKPGDEIQLITQKKIHLYQVTNKVLFQEVEVGLAQRLENARWISPTNDERLTLVTCWPNDSNTHRLIIVAAPK